MLDMVLPEFFAQGAAIDAKAGGRFRLVVVAVPQHGLEHGLLNFGNHGVEQVAGKFTVQIIQVFSNRLFHGLL